jgi:hypothetical protein
MTLRFQLRREDALEFNRQYHAASPTLQRTRIRLRFMLPVILIAFWGITTERSGFDWTHTIFFLGISLLWFFLYPAGYNRSLDKYVAKLIDEGSYRKNFGEYELTLTHEGLHSIAPSGESKFNWSSVDRTLLTDDYLFIFLNGAIGYPISISDIGSDSARAAFEYVNQHIGCKGDQGVTPHA